ncbi:tetraspanin-6 [Nematolebias whitei]|uniref:tetraspanin-6 n=1 Tax=Nematolebias whitei TaxID=451745 RepID=UPI001899DEA6|nr:tetraspanin-6 [Nematolebias whitei]
MGKINGCLKCVFIFFNVLFAIIGCLMIYAAVQSTAAAAQMSSFGGPGIGWIWVTSIGVFGISCLGIGAACSENTIALKIFAGFMGIGMIIMLIFGIIWAVIRSKTKQGFQSATEEFAQQFMTEENNRGLLDGIQQPLQCCGVGHAEDWADTIPDSCECLSSFSCKPTPAGRSGPAQIYSKPCGDIVFGMIDIVFKVAMGVYFGFSVTALFGLLITLLMIHQVSRHDGTGGQSVAMKSY